MNCIHEWEYVHTISFSDKDIHWCEKCGAIEKFAFGEMSILYPELVEKEIIKENQLQREKNYGETSDGRIES